MVQTSNLSCISLSTLGIPENNTELFDTFSSLFKKRLEFFITCYVFIRFFVGDLWSFLLYYRKTTRKYQKRSCMRSLVLFPNPMATNFNFSLVILLIY